MPAGAQIKDRYLASRTPEGVQPPGHLPVAGAEAAASDDGFVQGTIKVRLRLQLGRFPPLLPADYAPLFCAPQVFLGSAAAAEPAFPVIFAAGPISGEAGDTA